MRKPYFILSVCSFLLSLFILYTSSTAETNLRWLVNYSDHLFPFSIYNSIFSHETQPIWVFGGYTPFIELFFGFLIWLPLKNITFTFVIYAVIQICFVAASVIYLVYCIVGKNWKIISLVIAIFALVIIVAATGYMYAFNLLFYWYLHISTFAMGLIALALLIEFSNLKKNKHKHSWIVMGSLILICTLATASDALFISQFIAPAIIVMICMLIVSAVSFRRAVIAVISLLYATALGLILFNIPEVWGNKRMVLNGYYIQTAFSNLKNNIQTISDIFASIWQGNALIVFIWVSFYSLCIFLTLIAVRRWLKKSQGIIRQKLGMCTLFFLFQLNTALSAELISVEPAVRYILPVSFIPLFAGWPILASGFPRWMKFLRGRISYIPGAVLTGFAVIFLITDFHSANLLPDLWNYYPEDVQCIDLYTTRLNLHNGIAQYWQARPITLYSKTGLLVVQVMPNLEPFPILTNIDSYSNNFEFIILDNGPLTPTSINRGLVIQRFGEPATSFTCSNNEILVYNRTSDAAFAHQFDNFIYSGN